MSKKVDSGVSKFLEYYDKYWKGTEFDTPEWRDFWILLVRKESSFVPTAHNKEGAYGYFQLMPFNRYNGTSIEALFKDTLRLARSFLEQMTKVLSIADLKRAKEIGLTNKDLLRGAWLGGLNNVKKALNGANPKDSNGTGVWDYLLMDSDDEDDEDYEYDELEEYPDDYSDLDSAIAGSLEEYPPPQQEEFVFEKPNTQDSLYEDERDEQLLLNLSVINEQQLVIDQLQKENQLAQLALNQNNLLTQHEPTQQLLPEYSETSQIDELIQDALNDNSTAQQILSSLWSLPREDFAFANNPLLLDKEDLALAYQTALDKMIANGGHLHGDGGDGGINRDVSSIMLKYKGTIHDINIDKDAFTKVNSLNSTLDNIGFSEDTELQHNLADYFISYVNSDGYDRILKNQKDWWNSNHPILKHFDWLLGMDEATRALKRNTSRYAYNVPVFTMEMPVTSSFAGAKTGNVYLGIYPTDDFPYPFVAGHEFAHLLLTNTPSLGIQDEALRLNTNTRLEKSYSKRMHDSRPIEKHADIWGLKYLLYKTGIYDSRSNKDITPAQVLKLRDLYPGLRPLKQMNNKKAAWMLNHTAKNEIQNTINDNVFFPLGNYTAFGGNLFKDGGGLLDNLMNAVDTVKQRTQKAVADTRKQYQDEGYIYKNGKLTKKGRYALRSQHGITGRLMNETLDMIDKTERNLMLLNPIQFYDKKSEWFPGYKQVDLPWYKDLVITLLDAGSLTGAKIFANMFDSLYKAVNYNPLDMDIVENIGAKETTFGNPTDDNSFFKLKTSDKPTIAFLKALNKKYGNKWGNVQHINNGLSLTGSGLLNFGAWPNPWDDAWVTASNYDREEDVEKIKQRLIDSYDYTLRMDDYWRNSGEFDKNVILAAVELYKKGGYNPRLGNYVEYSTKKGNELRNSPTYKKYILPKRSKHSKRINKDDIWL